MADGPSKDLEIRVGIDPSRAVSGAQTASTAVGGLNATVMTAQQVADKWGVSLEIAQAALDKNKALQKATEINALAQAMREESTATQDTAAASEVAADAADDQAESTENLQRIVNEHQQALMRNVFYVHRLAEGFKDISMGGRVAGQGLMDVSEALQYMIAPEFAIYVVIAQVVGMLAVMATAHHRGGEAAAQHAEAEKEAADKAANAWSPAIAQLAGYSDVLKTLLDTQKLFLEQDDRITANAKARADLQKGAINQSKEQALQGLRQQYLTDQAKPQTDDDRKELKDRYEAARKDIEDGSTVNTALLEAAELEVQIGNAQRKLDDAKKQNDQDTLIAAEAQEAARQARTRLDPYGISLNKDKTALTTTNPQTGADFDPIQDISGKIDDAEHSMNLHAALDYGVTQTVEREGYIKQQKEYIGGLRRQRDQMKADLASLIRESDTEKTVGEKLPSQEQDISKLEEEVNNLKAQLPQKQEAVQLAATDQTQDRQQAGIDQGVRVDDATQKQIEKAVKEASAAAVAEGKQEEDKQKAASKAESAEEKANREQIENLTGQIEAKYIGQKDSPAIVALHKVLDLFKGKTDEQSQMAEISALMGIMATTYQAAIVKQAAINRDTHRRVDDLEKEVRKLK